MGNLRSVQKAFQAVGADARISSDPKTIAGARSVALPGVGAFKDCMANLDRLGLIEVIRKTVKSGKPFLGICLGLQVLFSQSEEFGLVPGLDLVPGKVKRFAPGLRDGQTGASLKIPHMGWNRVKFKHDAPLFDGIPDNSYFYFVHSYYVTPDDPGVAATTTQYGVDFVSGVHFDNVYAFQFHPEKSQKLGLTLLKNFSRLQ